MASNLLRSMVLMLSLGATLLGCGGGGGGGGGQTSTDLKGALRPTLKPGTITVVQALDSAGEAISDAAVYHVLSLDNVPGFGSARVVAASTPTDLTGTASLGLPAGNYERRLFPPSSTGVADGRYVSSISGQTATDTYIADKYTFTITSPVSLSSFTLTVYQCDADGNLDRNAVPIYVDPVSGKFDTTKRYRNIIVFDSPETGLTGAGPYNTSVQLFKGTYRVMITPAPANASESVATYVSDVITVSGATSGVGATVTKSLTLVKTGTTAVVTLKDTDQQPITDHHVEFYDNVSWMKLGDGVSDSGGGAYSSLIPSGFTNVLAVVSVGSDPTNKKTVAAYEFSNLAKSSTVVLQQYTVSGLLSPPAGQSLPNSQADIAVYLTTGTPLDIEPVATAKTTASTGVITGLTLFGAPAPGLEYTVRAANVVGFPDTTDQTVAVAGAVNDLSIPVAVGGLITGTVQTENNSPLADVTVDIHDADTKELVVSTSTDANGAYSAQVPYGNYFLFVNGSVIDNITITSGANVYTKDLTEYSLTAIVQKEGGSPVNGAKIAVGDYGAEVAGTTGVAAVKAMEGKNWICIHPGDNDPTLGYVCNTNVLVDSSTVEGSKQKPMQ